MGARYTREKLQNIKNEPSSGGNYKGIKWVDLKVDKNTPSKQVMLRLIGFPFAYKEASGYQQKLNPATKKMEWVETGFHDDHLYEKKKFNRICTENNPKYGVCPWESAGYRVTQKFAQNVIIRKPYKDASGKTFFENEVAVLQKGKMLFIEGILKKEEENELANENSGIDADDPDAACTFLGGERAHNIIIKADYNPKQPNNPDYTISIVPKSDTITESDIDLLAEAGTPTEEELAEIYADDPELEQYPVWFNYGYQLNKIFKPTPVKTANETTAVEDLSVSEEETPEPPKPKAKYTAKPAPKPAVEEVEDEDEFNVNLVDEEELDLMLD
jgi:hypothetical protein